MLPRHTKRMETSCLAVMGSVLSMGGKASRVWNPGAYPVKAAEGAQRVAHRALVRVQTRNDDEA